MTSAKTCPRDDHDSGLASHTLAWCPNQTMRPWHLRTRWWGVGLERRSTNSCQGHLYMCPDGDCKMDTTKSATQGSRLQQDCVPSWLRMHDSHCSGASVMPAWVSHPHKQHWMTTQKTNRTQQADVRLLNYRGDLRVLWIQFAGFASKCPGLNFTRISLDFI